MQFVFVDRPMPVLNKRPIGLPRIPAGDVVPDGNFHPVRAKNFDESIEITSRINQIEIVPSVANSCREFNLEVARDRQSISRNPRRRFHRHYASITQPKRIRSVIRIRQIIDEIIILPVVEGPGRIHEMNEFVNIDTLDQRQSLISLCIDVFKGRLIVDELSLNAGREQPTPLCNLTGIDSTKGRRERWGEALSLNFRADDMEVREQPLLILDDLRLSRDNRQISGRSIPHVVDHYGERVGLAWFNFIRKRIVCKHVTLMEVVHFELRVRQHSNRRAGEIDRDELPVITVLECAADVVLCNVGRSRIVGRDNDPTRLAGGVSIYDASAINRAQVRQRRRPNSKPRRHIVPRRIVNDHINIYVRERRRQLTIRQFQRRIERRPRLHEFLVKPDPHLRANAITRGQKLIPVCRGNDGRTRNGWCVPRSSPAARLAAVAGTTSATSASTTSASTTEREVA